MAARSLSRNLGHLSNSLSAAPASRLVNFRRRSNSSDAFTGEPPVPVAEEMEKVAMKNLEDAIYKVIVKRSQPNWIFLVPGASYWVPPKSKAQGLAQVIGKLVDDSTTTTALMKDKSFSLSPNRGWPSSAHFFKGASQSPLEGETTTQSEDEEW